MSELSSQHHSFDILLAKKYGVEESILIHHFLHWIRINRAAGRNIRDGRCWTYQTRKDIQLNFPYWNVDKVKYLCEKLAKMGVLVSTNKYNKSPIDNTLWYAFVNEKAFGVDEENSNNFYERQKCPSKGKSASPKGKSASPIPDTKPDTETKDKKEREANALPSSSDFLFIYCHIDEDDGEKTVTKIQMPLLKYEKLVKKHGKPKVDSTLKSLYEYSLSHPKDFARYGCFFTVVNKWIEREKKIYGTDSEKISKHHGFEKNTTPIDPKRVFDFR